MIRFIYIIPIGGSQDPSEFISDRIRVGNIFNADRQKCILSRSTSAGENFFEGYKNIDTYSDLDLSANKLFELQTDLTSPLKVLGFPVYGVDGGGGVSGSGVAGQVAFWDGESSIAGDTGFQYDSTLNHFGLGAAAQSNITLYATETLNTNGEVGFYGNFSFFATADTSIIYGGISRLVNTGGNTGHTLIGLIGSALNATSTGSVTELIAIRADIGTDEPAGGIVIDAYGFKTFSSTAFYKATRATGVKITNMGGLGTTARGLWIDNQTGGTTNWAIASDGGNSYHVGKFMIGSTSTPNNPLHVFSSSTIPARIETTSGSGVQSCLELVNSIGNINGNGDGSSLDFLATNAVLSPTLKTFAKVSGDGVINDGTALYKGRLKLTVLNNATLRDDYVIDESASTHTWGLNGTSNMVLNATGLRIGSTVAPTVALDVTGASIISTSLTTPIVIGSSAASGTLTLRATSSATDGNILFQTDATTERARILSTGEFLVGATSLVSSGDVANFYKNGNDATAIRVTNNTLGTIASASIFLSANNGTNSCSLAAFNASYSSSGMSVANTARFASNLAGGMNAGTVSNSQFSIWTNNLLRITISGAGLTTWEDALNIAFGTTTGTKIGTATSQKIGFWNVTPIIQPTTAVASATFVANAGTTVNDASTFDGYTLGKVVKALRNIGLLA